MVGDFDRCLQAIIIATTCRRTNFAIIACVLADFGITYVQDLAFSVSQAVMLGQDRLVAGKLTAFAVANVSVVWIVCASL